MAFQTKIKICGLTSPEDIIAAVKARADLLGFVFYKKSSRYIIPTTLLTEVLIKLPP